MLQTFSSILFEIYILVVFLITLCYYTIYQRIYSKKLDYHYLLMLVIFLFFYLVFI